MLSCPPPAFSISLIAFLNSNVLILTPLPTAPKSVKLKTGVLSLGIGVILVDVDGLKKIEDWVWKMKMDPNPITQRMVRRVTG